MTVEQLIAFVAQYGVNPNVFKSVVEEILDELTPGENPDLDNSK